MKNISAIKYEMLENEMATTHIVCFYQSKIQYDFFTLKWRGVWIVIFVRYIEQPIYL